ncbi:MAG: nucleotide-binding protein [Verrucomicrobia bacterium]|nr:nucleotide-binding protein [Verrucomicrobiota bacterium]
MSELSEKLFVAARQLEEIVKEATSIKITEPLEKLIEVSNQVGRAWSGSWIGYQSRVYYADFAAPPPGAHFSSEWGFQETFSQDSTGDWAEYTFDGVRQTIFSSAGVASLERVEKLARRAKDAFQSAREDFLSVAVVSLENKSDGFLSRLKDQVEKLQLINKFDLARALQPKQIWSRDSLAMSQGVQTPPHLAVLAEISALKNPVEKCDELAKIVTRAASHLESKERNRQEKRRVGTNVFIGHGRSLLWRELKDFVQDRLGLPSDEFNRVPVAGITNTERLREMLDDAAVAFIILTAEDEQVDAKMHPRLNVVHEAGLFQGKLGFTKAIVLLEEGCEEFSNIQGLGQIRFQKGNIKGAFEEIRRVLEREGLIEP